MLAITLQINGVKMFDLTVGVGEETTQQFYIGKKWSVIRGACLNRARDDVDTNLCKFSKSKKYYNMPFSFCHVGFVSNVFASNAITPNFIHLLSEINAN